MKRFGVGAQFAAVSGTCWLAIAQPAIAQSLPAGADPARIEGRFETTAAPTVTPTSVRGLESTIAPDQAAAIELTIRSVTVDGVTVYGDDELTALFADLRGKKVTLSEVFEVAAAVTARYGGDGYILTRAIVPPQELNPDGADITIRVIEGYVDAVEWPEFTGKYRDLFSAYSAKITADRPLNIRTLERYLLLANDLPGLSFESNLSASPTNTGASTLVITGAQDRFDGSVSIDNHGVDASGPYQATLSANLNNQLRIHDRLSAAFSVAGLSDDNRLELGYLSFGYEQLVNSEGLSFFIDGNASWGRPGSASLLAFDTETKGLNISTGVRFPFIRSREKNLTGTLAFDFKNSSTTNLGGLVTEDRLRIIRGELDYEFADERGGVNQFGLGAHLGINGLGSTSNGNPLASRSGGRVDFFRLTASAARTQKLGRGFSLYGSVRGQFSGHSLLSSQECGYGGRVDGRGFDSSIITGDHCVKAALELRRDLQVPSSMAKAIDTIQPYAFIDYGYIANINPPLGTPAADDGASIGVGLRLGGKRFSADFGLSHIIDAPVSQPGIQRTRGWFRTTARF